MNAKCFMALIVSLGAMSASLVSAENKDREVIITLKAANGKDVGTARISEMAKGVRLKMELEGLTPGEHAVHFHEKGVCTGPDFKSAGGHFSTSKNEHGYDNVKGAHEGDMPNIFVHADGKARVEILNSHVTLANGKNSLLKAGGTALVIHADADDHRSQPAGNAGDRIACGVIGQ